MAKSESRYVQFYTAGSSAYKVELRQEQEWAPLPKYKPLKRVEITVDPVALIGCVVAVCMLILMAVGIHRLNQTRQEVEILERYVAQLTAENAELSQQYAEGYEPEDIRRKALDMGMIPAEEALQISLPAAGEVQSAKEATIRTNALLSDLPA